VYAHGTHHRTLVGQRHDCARERIDIITVVVEKPLFQTKYVVAQRMCAGKMGGPGCKSDMEAAGNWGAEKGYGLCQWVLLVLC
jgi:hypothetical protein